MNPVVCLIAAFVAISALAAVVAIVHIRSRPDIQRMRLFHRAFRDGERAERGAVLQLMIDLTREDDEKPPRVKVVK